MKKEKNTKIFQSHGHTFVIQIKGTANNSWQGTVEWTETQQKIPFRSALELIKLLDSAIAADTLDE